MNTPDTEINVLSIDAWADGDGWQWNQWFKAGKVPLYLCDLPEDELLAEMVERGFITQAEGADVEDDQYNLVIVDKKTREPIFALEYGAVY